MIQVPKFGGSSLGTSERIQTIVGIVQARSRKCRLVVVFSAMGGVTNQIIQAMEAAEREGKYSSVLIDTLRERHLLALNALAEGESHDAALREIDNWLSELHRKLSGVAILRECTSRSAASIISIGERLSLSLMSAALLSAGMSVHALDATQLIRTNREYLDAGVDFQASERLIRDQIEALPEKDIVVVNGFIGATSEGEITTLGRSGSDYTAAILGRSLHAEQVEIWTDVNGVLSADPRVIQNPVSLSDISYREASEMAFYGAKVLHPKTMQPLEAKQIPLVIRNTFQPDHPGTRIQDNTPGKVEKSSVTAITAVGQIALITIAVDAHDTTSTTTLLNSMTSMQKGMISANFSISEATLNLVVHAGHADEQVQNLRRLLQMEEHPGQNIEIAVEKDLSLLAVVGTPGVLRNGNLNRIFETFTRHRIATRSIGSGASSHSLSIILNQRDLDRAMKVLHEAYFSSPKSRTAQMLAAACA